MTFNTSRRGFLRGIGGVTMLGAAGCCNSWCGRSDKIRLAVVGVMGKGYTDWSYMLKTGKVEIVALCDADYKMREEAQLSLAKDGIDFDLYRVPFFTDYRKLLDSCALLGVNAMTISTPDHVHAPVAIEAMKQGIHVYVQKPLVRTLWELDYFNRTAKENGVIVQMGNQGSSLSSMRRCTEVIQSGILGDVKEVHVWTNRPVWPQGKAVADWVKGHPKGEKTRRPGLNWDAWLATAAERPFLDKYPDNLDVYDPWGLGKNVYHRFTWRGFFDFGCGAFGDMACHTMNLAFRGLELGTVTDAECIRIEQENDISYPTKSLVKMTYAARDSKLRKGVRLPAVTLYWYDGYDASRPGKCGNKPNPAIMPKAVKTFGAVPDTGCYIIGSKGAVLMKDDYGRECYIAMGDEKEFSLLCDVTTGETLYEGAKAIARSIPFRTDSAAATGKSTVEMKGFAIGHYVEFVDAILGKGPYYEQTHSRCFSDVEYCVPQMEGILVGCVAQRLPGKKLNWNSASQSFDLAAANAFVKPFIRDGFGF